MATREQAIQEAAAIWAQGWLTQTEEQVAA
jgi:hypothetical protein